MGVKEEIFSMNKKHHLMVYVSLFSSPCALRRPESV